MAATAINRSNGNRRFPQTPRCVSTVSIVCDRDGHRLRGWAPASQISSTVALADGTGRCRRRLP